MITQAKIKVCGMRDAENIREVEALGIDMMGFIFYPKSSRYVSDRPAYLPQKCKRVGVFVDATGDAIRQHITNYSLDIIQLHGHESPDYCQQLREWEIIKAFNIATPSDLESTKPVEGIADYFLFDTKGKSVGGNGEKFDWNVLNHYNGDTPFLLSGGIGPDDAERIKALFALDGFPIDKCIGIDLNSGIETAPAMKDTALHRSFLSQLTQ